MASNSGRDFVLEVIGMYRDHPCLWQVVHADYHDKLKRNKALDDFLPLFKTVDNNSNRETVQKKLASIRSAFNKELRKVLLELTLHTEKLCGVDIMARPCVTPIIWTLAEWTRPKCPGPNGSAAGCLVKLKIFELVHCEHRLVVLAIDEDILEAYLNVDAQNEAKRPQYSSKKGKLKELAV
nr:unnamed protein product [Callosobruchus chinensis]